MCAVVFNDISLNMPQYAFPLDIQSEYTYYNSALHRSCVHSTVVQSVCKHDFTFLCPCIWNGKNSHLDKWIYASCVNLVMDSHSKNFQDFKCISVSQLVLGSPHFLLNIQKLSDKSSHRSSMVVRMLPSHLIISLHRSLVFA